MTTEAITWTPIAAGLPDADTTVLISLDETHNEPTFAGFYGGEGWFDVNGAPIEGVLGWADMPAGIAHPPASAATQAVPVYLVQTGQVYEGRETYERYEGKPPPMCDYEGPLYAAPAAPPVALPALTDDERAAFDTHWRTFTSDGRDTQRDVRIANFAAWHAWMARSRLALPALTDEWQPIATAPQNRRVLVAYRNSLGKWRRVMACYYPPETLESEQDESGFAPEGWYEEATAAEEIYFVEGEPELWREIPALPDEPSAILAASAAPAPEQRCESQTHESEPQQPLPSMREPQTALPPKHPKAEDFHLAGNRNEAPCGDEAVDGERA